MRSLVAEWSREGGKRIISEEVGEFRVVNVVVVRRVEWDVSSGGGGRNEVEVVFGVVDGLIRAPFDDETGGL